MHGLRLFVSLLLFWSTSLPAQPQVSSSKLSAHLIGNYTAGSSNIVYGRPVVLKVLGLDGGWPSGMIQAMRNYRAKAPGGRIVARIYSPKQYTMADDAVWAAGDFWTNILLKSLNYLSASDRALIDYLEGPNEGQTPTLGYPSEAGLDASRWFNRFWTNLTPRIVAAGYQPCIGSIAVGNPGGDMQAHLAEFVPALRQAKAAAGSWSYHAYTLQYTTDPAVEIWYSLRYRQFYQFFAGSYPDLITLPLILTEGGVDESGNPNTSGWRARGTAADYQRWLNWFDQELRKDGYVTGCTLFQNGDPGGWWSFDLEPIATWLRDYLLPPAGVPPAPSGLSAAAELDGITLKWASAPATPLGYNIKRATNNSGPFITIATNVTTGVQASTFKDGSAQPGIDYFYCVTAMNAVGEGPRSLIASARKAVPWPIRINCGGPSVGSFLADIDYDAGTAYATSTVINTNGLDKPAPASAYQSQRYGNFLYRVRAPSPGTVCKVRLHFAEVWWLNPGERVFDVSIGGAPVLENFDIVAAVGGAFKGVIKEFNAVSDAAGEVAIRFQTRVDNASVNAIEVLPVSAISVPGAPTGFKADVSAALVTLTWNVPEGASGMSLKRATTSGGPYTVIAANLTAGVYRDVSFVPGMTYYYVVNASNYLGQSADSAVVSATPMTGLPDVMITSVGWTPLNVSNGNRVVFWARVLNQGSTPTPTEVLGVGFVVDGKGTAAWSSGRTAPLAPNESVVLAADGGPTGNYWTATPGRHTLVATVDDINRFPESLEDNNGYGTNFLVRPARPVITACVVSNGSTVINWTTTAGASYALQTTDSISQPVWESSPPLTAAGSTLSWRSFGLPASRFFRVWLAE